MPVATFTPKNHFFPSFVPVTTLEQVLLIPGYCHSGLLQVLLCPIIILFKGFMRAM